MNRDDIILIEAGSSDFTKLKEAIEYAEETGSYIRFYTEASYSTQVFEPGDRIEAAFDAGWGPATVVSAGPDGVSITYGRGGKYHANVSYGSVRTDKHKVTPAILKFKAYEGEWTLGVESHRPNGGY